MFSFFGLLFRDKVADSLTNLSQANNNHSVRKREDKSKGFLQGFKFRIKDIARFLVILYQLDRKNVGFKLKELENYF